MNIFSLLDQLKIRTAMFLGNDYNFNSLNNFISGFTMAASDVQLELNHYPNFGYFNTWILGHLKKHFGLAGGWHWQIKKRNPNNDEKAFEEFFNFLEIFKSSKTHLKSVIVDKEAVEFKKKSALKRFETKDGKEIPINKIPFKIVWRTIENSTTVWLDYIDKNEKVIIRSHWFINAEAATYELETEFGRFKNIWIDTH